MIKHKFRRSLLYGLFVIARILLPLLPLWLIRLLGRWLGIAAYAVLGAPRRLALTHLEQALGTTRTPREHRRIARRMFASLGMNALEWMVFGKFTAARVERLVRVEGMAHVQAAQAAGRGIIFVSAHFGNWELLAAYFGLQGLRGGVVARRLRYPEYEQWLINMRRAKGVETFLRDTSFKELLRRLKAGECIGIMPDQDIDSIDGVFVEFFGRPTHTPTGPAVLALTTGAALLPAFIRRDGARFVIHVEPPVTVARTEDRARDVQALTQAWSRVTERYIRTYPEQWVWMHRRWKTQPPATQPAAAPVAS